MFLRAFEHRQVYQPAREVFGRPSDLGLRHRDVPLETSDGLKLAAWFFPARKGAQRSDWVLLHCHGNAGNITSRLDHYQALLDTGANVMAFDYRGYGASEGSPGEEGTYLDAEAAFDWLRAEGFPPERIAIVGESLGGGVAAGLAARRKVAGLVLQSTFTSVPDLGAEIFPFLPVRLISSIGYNTLERLPDLQVPVLVMHSRADEIIGFHHGEKLFERANEPKRFVELKGGHNETLISGPEVYSGGLTQFLEDLNTPAPGGAETQR